MANFESTPEFLRYFDNLCQREKPLVWIATISRDGRPHLVPSCFVRAIDDDKIAIGCVFIEQTVRNVLRNQDIAIGSSKLENGYNGFMIKGRAQVLDSGKVFEEMKEAVYNATNGRRTIKRVMLVSIKNLYSLKPGEGRKRIE
jgi:predicted pyridoxine 5'-phosphate oxidase superfamily flavin-nucleotide-binding protein